jgi:hypothetical protein
MKNFAGTSSPRSVDRLEYLPGAFHSEMLRSRGPKAPAWLTTSGEMPERVHGNPFGRFVPLDERKT